MARTITGHVSSAKGKKTIVVAVATRKTHPIYKKQYTETRRYMAHDERDEAREGDRVQIEECRPLSAKKRYTLVKILETAHIKHVEPEAAVETSEDEK